MKTTIFKLAVILGMTLAGTVQAQEPDHKRLQPQKTPPVGARLEIPQDAAGRKRFERRHYERTLGLDSVKAEQVLKAQSDYKSAVKRVLADTTLNEAGRRAAIDALIDVKNAKLEKLLTPVQQSKIIPTTERRAVRAVKAQ